MELRAAAERIARAHDAHSPTLSLSGAFIVHLEDLPAELSALTHLTHLDLSYNVLATLPDSLGELTAMVAALLPVPPPSPPPATTPVAPRTG